jgi:hypothetical protein
MEERAENNCFRLWHYGPDNFRTLFDFERMIFQRILDDIHADGRRFIPDMCQTAAGRI